MHFVANKATIKSTFLTCLCCSARSRLSLSHFILFQLFCRRMFVWKFNQREKTSVDREFFVTVWIGLVNIFFSSAETLSSHCLPLEKVDKCNCVGYSNCIAYKIIQQSIDWRVSAKNQFSASRGLRNELRFARITKNRHNACKLLFSDS